MRQQVGASRQHRAISHRERARGIWRQIDQRPSKYLRPARSADVQGPGLLVIASFLIWRSHYGHNFRPILDRAWGYLDRSSLEGSAIFFDFSHLLVGRFFC